jgi:hypothetical protein
MLTLFSLSDMKSNPLYFWPLLAVTTASSIEAPSGFISQAGDQSIILHWDRNAESNVGSYRVYHSPSNAGPFVLLSSTDTIAPGYCDLNVTNGQTNFYYVTAVTTSSQESTPSATLAATSHPFANDDEFLDYVQQACFDYFWYAANPTNGMVPDRSAKGSPCSIAAVGFGLTAIGIAIDHGWITRAQGITRVANTLDTFLNLPQGTNSSGTIGYKGWFYHFLDMNTGLRYTPFNTELSSIDTALLLGGILYAKQYFNGTNSAETSIRTMADSIFNRIDWNWMARGTNAVSMGWYPDTGFLAGNWIGYNEGMIIYTLGVGANSNALPSTAWSRWTSGYRLFLSYGYTFVPFGSLFAHQYSHCWIDYRHMADTYMTAHNSTYFENSRRATLANRAYCINNPSNHVGYSSNVWGLTACDGPNLTNNGVIYLAYAARQAAGSLDDGTVAPTAAGGSTAFTPEYSIPTLRYMYTTFLRNIWTAYGFRDAFNLDVNWWDTDELGIDQGPIIIMIENYRTQKVWQLFMRNPEVQRGLQRAGFVSLPSIPSTLQTLTAQNACNLTWNGIVGRVYQIEYSPDLESWFVAPTGELTATNPTVAWVDSGPPGTGSAPLDTPQRFYRVIKYGPP